jgi:hypothetical protein
MKFEPIRRFAFRTISQIGISYPQSALSQALAGLSKSAPAAGERFPWLRIRLRPDGPIEDLYGKFEDTSFNLLVFGQAAAQAEFGELVRTHLIPRIAANDRELARANISQPSFYLLRPDGHVGLCGPGFDAAAIRQYLGERVRFKA